MSRHSGVFIAWRDFAPTPVAPLLQAALDCFVARGYHGTTTRELAAAAGLSVPGLYHHVASKQAMLVDLMAVAMTELYERSLAALAEAGGDVLARLQLHVECLVLFHAHRQQLAFLAAAEIRGLEPAARATHIAARDRQQRILDVIVDEGSRAGLFHVANTRVTSRAVVTICTGVAQWYHRDGDLSPEQLAIDYVALAERMLGLVGRNEGVPGG